MGDWSPVSDGEATGKHLAVRLIKGTITAVDVGTQYPLGVKECLDPEFVGLLRVTKRRLLTESVQLIEKLKALWVKVQECWESVWNTERQLERGCELPHKQCQFLVKQLQQERKNSEETLSLYWELNVVDQDKRALQRNLEAIQWNTHKLERNLIQHEQATRDEHIARKRVRAVEHAKLIAVINARAGQSAEGVGADSGPQLEQNSEEVLGAGVKQKRARVNPTQQRRLKERLGIWFADLSVQVVNPAGDNSTPGVEFKQPEQPTSPAPSVGSTGTLHAKQEERAETPDLSKWAEGASEEEEGEQ